MSNDFLPFAGGGGANVLSQSAYAALTSLIANGFQTGTASSQQVNKVLRQTSIMAAVLAQFIVDTTGISAVDDGTTATLLTNLKAAILSPAESDARYPIYVGDAGGTADALTATVAAAITTPYDGMLVSLDATSTNVTTTPTFNLTLGSTVNGAKTIVRGNGSACSVGDIVAGRRILLGYSTPLTAWVLVNPALSNPIATALQAQTQTDNTVLITPSGLASALGGANQNKATSGYQKLPGGLIIQWGTGSAGTITFPIAFPSACTFAKLSSYNYYMYVGNAYAYAWEPATTALTSANFTTSNNGAGGGSGGFTNAGWWIAIGY